MIRGDIINWDAHPFVSILVMKNMVSMAVKYNQKKMSGMTEFVLFFFKFRDKMQVKKLIQAQVKEI